jgi:hypothetical protein
MLKTLFWGVLVGVSLSMPALAVPAASQGSIKTKPSAAKPARKALVPPVDVVVVYTALSAAQLAVADKVALGKIPCELAAHVSIVPNPQSAGRFILELGREKHFMEPVLTSTGAVRLEDEKSGAVWLQLANKSMLMNQKQGKRLADDCMNADQLRVAQAMERSPQPGLLDPLVVEVASPAAGNDRIQKASATN